ncbi:MAG: OmpH family outer membrane protein [Candidatus Hydrogenedentes bacterium]|nr:OmpH family outer membrane protein [Candidatus Hydrogenedentota bacterium]
MTPQRKRRIWILTGVCGAALAALLGSQGTTRAAEGFAIGTFEPGRIAEATGLQQRLSEQIGGLQQRMQQAQQEGDQEQMQQIQSEAQAMQQKAVAEFEASIDKALPAVAEEAGLKLIAVEVSYMAPDITSKDVTDEVIEEMGGAVAAAPELSLPPLQGQ